MSCCPVLHYGVPVVARRFEKFDPEEAFALMARAQIRNAFIPPTALRMLRAAPNPKGRHAINMRSIGSGGKSLGAETYEWGKSAFGLVINEFYGQTECNIVLAACNAIGVSKPVQSVSPLRAIPSGLSIATAIRSRSEKLARLR